MLEKINKKSIINYIGIICLFLGAGVLIRTSCLIGVSDIWFDELFTVSLANKPLPELIALASRDVHPPIYYVIVRMFVLIFRAVNPNIAIEVVAKFTSIIPLFIIFIYGVTYVRARFGWLSAGLMVLFIETMPQLPQFMVEARMYSWAILAVIAMLIHGMEYVYDTGVNKRHLVLAVLYGILAMYLHYYSFVCAATIGVCMLIFQYVNGCKNAIGHKNANGEGLKRILPIIISMIICLIAYIPWIKNLMGQVGAVASNYWIPPVTIRTFAGCIKYVFKPDFENSAYNYFCVGIMLATYVVLLVKRVCVKEGQEPQGRHDSQDGWRKAFVLFTFVIPVVLVLFGYIASILLRPIFVYRYLTPAMGVFWMGYAILIGGTVEQGDCLIIDKRLSGLKRVLPIVVGVIVCTVMLTMMRRDYNLFKWEEEKKQAGMEVTDGFFDLVKTEYPDSVLVCNFNQLQAILWHYLDNASILWGETEETLIAEIEDRYPIEMTDDTDALISKVREINPDADSFVFIGSGNARDEIIEIWKEHGYTTDMLVDSCLLERYYFNVYEVKLN